MGLTEYRKKRNFRRTAEPEGNKGSAGKKGKKKSHLIFVVQQHAASHLHYDFRLEMEGVLKSWAVPKGPSMNPDDKRLAMKVEDHPFGYKDFEGIIPEGNYGAGSVIVWDNGWYHLPEHSAQEGDEEKTLLEGLKKGHISFVLEGKKLKGEFSLIHVKGRQENSWLLIKKKDEYATTEDIREKNRSVKSNKKLEDIKGPSPAQRKTSRNSVSRKTSSQGIQPKKKSPAKIRPMLAERTEHPFDHPDWIFENKHDGYRALAAVNHGEVELYSRRMLSFNSNYPSIAEELKKIDHSALLDGEIVVEDKKGVSGFQLLQNFNPATDIPKYYVFDLLELNGYKLYEVPLINRKELLKTLFENTSLKNIYYSGHVKEKGIAFFKKAEEKKLEGIIAKRANSIYRPGKRTRDWLKIKVSQQQEAVIAGFTPPKGSRSFFGSLLLAIRENGAWKYIGSCGTGFTEKTLETVYREMVPLFTSGPPFKDPVKPGSTPVQWLKPKLVCEVKFSEWTRDNMLRHPVFMGLRKDKTAEEAIKE